MKPSLVNTKVLILSLVVILAGLTQTAHAAKCSTETVAGDWSFTLNGTLILPTGNVLVGAVATGTIDRNGTLTNGTEARNVGGGYAEETLTGYWTVNSDCTGTLYANIYESGVLVRVSVVSVTFDDDSAEMRGVQKSLTLPDGTNVPVVLTLEAHKQHSDH